MNLISNAVGPGQPNLKPDVAVIQRLLNEHLYELIPLAPLVVDGKFGSKTEWAIKLFQSRVLGLPNPDGSVVPHGPAFQALTNVDRDVNRSPALSGSPPARPGTAVTSQNNHYPAHVNSFIAMALPGARAASAKWCVPVSVIIAQSALESGWGKTVKQNAYFGIKGHAPSGASTTFGTTEVIDGKVIHIKDKFRAYTSYEDSAEDYGRFLNENSRYRAAFSHTDDPIKFAQEVAKAGYATAPDYGKKLTMIIKGFNLKQYDAQGL